MLNNIQNNLIEEFLMDTTYSFVSQSINNFKLLVLWGYKGEENKTSLLAFILIMNEKKETFENIFIYLKNNKLSKNFSLDVTCIAVFFITAKVSGETSKNIN